LDWSTLNTTSGIGILLSFAPSTSGPARGTGNIFSDENIPLGSIGQRPGRCEDRGRPAAGPGGQVVVARLLLGEPLEQITEHGRVVIADPGHERRLLAIDGAGQLAVQGPAARRHEDKHPPAVPEV